tara:strand:+ start:241 stop:498 length:258 start_codon:yes stop_codon:yes gene_type:complete
MYRAQWYRTKEEAQEEFDRLENIHRHNIAMRDKKKIGKDRRPLSIRFIQWPPSGAYERDAEGKIIDDDITQGLHFANRWAQYQLM